MSEHDEHLTPEVANNKRKYYKSVFDKFDTNKSGLIERKELIEKLNIDNDVPRNISKKLFQAADKNKNEVLDFEEFQAMVQNKDYEEAFSKYVNICVRHVLPRRKIDVDGIYEEEYSCWPLPVGLVIITILEFVFFVIDESYKDNSSYYGPTSKIFIYDPYNRQEAWRFLTYMFVHIGYTHLTVNLIVQISLGIPLEMVHKYRVLVVYFSGVVAGSLGTSIVDPRTFLAGASGGVYALITAHIGTIFMNWKEMEFPVIQLIVFVVIISFDVGTSIYNRYFLNLHDNIGYAAHFAGAIAGLLVGIWNLKNFVPNRKERYVWWCALTIYILFMGTMIFLNIFWTNHFLSNLEN